MEVRFKCGHTAILDTLDQMADVCPKCACVASACAAENKPADERLALVAEIQNTLKTSKRVRVWIARDEGKTILHVKERPSLFSRLFQKGKITNFNWDVDIATCPIETLRDFLADIKSHAEDAVGLAKFGGASIVRFLVSSKYRETVIDELTGEIDADAVGGCTQEKKIKWSAGTILSAIAGIIGLIILL